MNARCRGEIYRALVHFNTANSTEQIVHKARKRFGQNFLVDERIIADIIAAIRPEPEDNMVEIGPGLGATASR